jgi:hypothetical protein
MEDIGDGYRSHEEKRPSLRESFSRGGGKLYPTWAEGQLREWDAIAERNAAVSARISELCVVEGNLKAQAESLRWDWREARDAHVSAQHNAEISDEEVEYLSNAAWWATQDSCAADAEYEEAVKARKAAEASYEPYPPIEGVSVRDHWCARIVCATCTEARAELAVLEARGPR